MITAISITVICLGSLAFMYRMVSTAPLYDADERPVDEVQDDPRPGDVLREGWGGLS
ncbi:hypothetical protein UFOVP319_61 [uncultured Caudovirales phage]|uniref:Uncharacterized protein n=1 Tax=uncultured Caudovirales phage TaxID=2100421 RepID=A0A6J5LT25_9CAUD|nr:hypothetical protein UFOVP319_61 [uncultured Caudovirales phage]